MTCAKAMDMLMLSMQTKKNHVHQCWECDSEGEFYIYEPQDTKYDNVTHGNRNTYKFLH